MASMRSNGDRIKRFRELKTTLRTQRDRLLVGIDVAKAEDVARRIEGAKEVKNLLQVVPGAQRAIVQRSDDEIKKSVDAAFKAN